MSDWNDDFLEGIGVTVAFVVLSGVFLGIFWGVAVHGDFFTHRPISALLALVLLLVGVIAALAAVFFGLAGAGFYFVMGVRVVAAKERPSSYFLAWLKVAVSLLFVLGLGLGVEFIGVYVFCCIRDVFVSSQKEVARLQGEVTGILVDVRAYLCVFCRRQSDWSGMDFPLLVQSAHVGIYVYGGLLTLCAIVLGARYADEQAEKARQRRWWEEAAARQRQQAAEEAARQRAEQERLAAAERSRQQALALAEWQRREQQRREREAWERAPKLRRCKKDGMVYPHGLPPKCPQCGDDRNQEEILA